MSTFEQANAIADAYRDDPHAWGRAQQEVGELLVADRLKGVGTNAKGKKAHPRILNSLPFVLMGALMFGFVVWGTGVMFRGDAETTGTVTSVPRHTTSGSTTGHSRSSSRKTTCKPVVAYTVADTTYSTNNTSGANGCDVQPGDKVTVEYKSADPTDAQAHFKNNCFAVGVFGLLALGMFGLGVRDAGGHISTAVRGARLARTGRDRAQSHTPGSRDTDATVAEVRDQMLALLAQSRRTLRSDSGPAGEPAHDTTQTSLPTQPDHMPSAVPPPVPPPGWYATADGLHERYWDGANWSEQARPTAPPQ